MKPTLYIDMDEPSNGSGSLQNPLNRPFVAAQAIYAIKRGSKRPVPPITFWPGSDGAEITAYGDADALPVLDCAQAIIGVDTRGRTDCVVSFLRVVNQRGTPPFGGIKLTGARHHVHHVETAGCQVGIHDTSAGSTIELGQVDIGFIGAKLASAWGIRSIGPNPTVRDIDCLASAEFDFGTALDVGGSTRPVVTGNRLRARGCDQLMVRRADGAVLVDNVVGCPGMLDGIGINDLDGALLDGNLVLHFGDVPGHAGPCLQLGDDYGRGRVATNVTVRRNILMARNNMPLSIKPQLGAGCRFEDNDYWRTGVDAGRQVVNFWNDARGAFEGLTLKEWIARGHEVRTDAAARTMAKLASRLAA